MSLRMGFDNYPDRTGEEEEGLGRGAGSFPSIPPRPLSCLVAVAQRAPFLINIPYIASSPSHNSSEWPCVPGFISKHRSRESKRSRLDSQSGRRPHHLGDQLPNPPLKPTETIIPSQKKTTLGGSVEPPLVVPTIQHIFSRSTKNSNLASRVCLWCLIFVAAQTSSLRFFGR